MHKATPLSPTAARRIYHHESDVLIVGAGILGTALAITLARPPHSRSVTLLERSLKEPDRIVGELLQPGGVSALKELGLSQCLEGIDSIRVQGYEVIYYGQGVEIGYPEEAGETINGTKHLPNTSEKQEVKRPEGRSFHHGRFISRLRSTALSEPNISFVETTVTGTVRDTYTSQILGVECLTAGEKDVFFAHLTVVADGYASKFRKEYIPRSVVSKSKFWGLELIDAVLPRPLHGHVVLGEGAPVLLYQIGTRETRALVDVPEGTESATPKNGGVKGHLRNNVLPSLPPSVRPSFSKALDEGKLRSMPNSFLPPSVNRVPGLVMLGDAMNMRHPLTGGGMTVAFNDVVLLRELLSPETVPDFADTKKVLRQMERFHWRRKGLTSVINILAQALYSLFAANGIISSSLPTSLHSVLTVPRPPTQSPATRLLPLLPAGRAMRRRPCRPPRRNNPPAASPLLPFLLRRTALDLACAVPVAMVQMAASTSRQRRNFLESMLGHLPVHILGAERLSKRTSKDGEAESIELVRMALVFPCLCNRRSPITFAIFESRPLAPTAASTKPSISRSSNPTSLIDPPPLSQLRPAPQLHHQPQPPPTKSDVPILPAPHLHHQPIPPAPPFQTSRPPPPPWGVPTPLPPEPPPPPHTLLPPPTLRTTTINHQHQLSTPSQLHPRPFPLSRAPLMATIACHENHHPPRSQNPHTSPSSVIPWRD